jgi:hypothetical protein
VDEAVVYLHTNNSSVSPCHDFGGLTAGWGPYSTSINLNGLSQCDTGKPLTAAQLTAALAGFDGIGVRVLNHDVGSYDVGLDNASFSAPQSSVTAPTGTVQRELFTTLRMKGRKLSGTLAAPDDYSCAGNTHVTIFRQAKRLVTVATTTTAPHGGEASFSVKLKRLRRGSYYASVRTETSPLDGNTCSAAVSKNIRVR